MKNLKEKIEIRQQITKNENVLLHLIRIENEIGEAVFKFNNWLEYDSNIPCKDRDLIDDKIKEIFGEFK